MSIKSISDLKEYAETVENTSVTSDGTKLTTSEKWREIADIYREIQNEIENRINEIVEAGAEGNKDLLDELNKQYEEYSQKISDTFKFAVKEEQDLVNSQKDKYSKLYDERISKIKEQQEAAKKAADTEIDALESKIDYLKKVNDERTSELEIEKARQELAKAEQHTRKVYGENGTVSYQADKEKVKEAQEAYNKALLDKQVRLLEDQKDALEKTKDKQSEAYDAIITNLESQKEEGERQFDILLQKLDEYLNPDQSESNTDVWSKLAKMEGAKYEDGVWSDKDGNVIDLEELKKSAETKTEEEKKAETYSNNSKDKDNKSNTAMTFEGFLSRMEKTLNLKAGSLTPENVQKIFANSPAMNYNPYEAMKDKTGIANREYVSNVNNNNNASNVTVGDIHIHKPVGDSYDLAKELQANLHNAADRVIYSNLK